VVRARQRRSRPIAWARIDLLANRELLAHNIVMHRAAKLRPSPALINSAECGVSRRRKLTIGAVEIIA